MSGSVCDDAGREVESAARRIVSLVPSLSELVCDLGAAERLVGVTRYCTHPARELARLARVGGTKNPQREAIAALSPDLILVDRDENRREDFEWLAARFAVYVAHPRTVERVEATVRGVASLLDRAARGERVAGAIAAARCGARPESSPRRVFCPIWRNPWMSFNGAAYASDLISVSGGVNVCGTDTAPFPEVDLAEIATADPEVILLPDEPYVFTAAHRDELALLSATTAWRNDRVHLADGKALFWYGKRTAAAIAYLRELLGG